MSDLTIYFLVTVFISALETFTYIREDKKEEKEIGAANESALRF